jgi:hypothetical protein
LTRETAYCEPYLFDELEGEKYHTDPGTGLKIYDGFDYYDDNAEACVYLVQQSGFFAKNCVYVMTRKEAVRFCSRKETRGSVWFFAFTTYKRDWRENIKLDFRKDDGRFDWLLKELQIVPIFRITEGGSRGTITR